MKLQYPFGDGETKPRPCGAFLPMIADPIVPIKDMREVLWRNPVAGILNLSHDPLIPKIQGDRDSAPLWSVSDGVLNEVFKNPFDKSDIP